MCGAPGRPYRAVPGASCCSTKPVGSCGVAPPSSVPRSRLIGSARVARRALLLAAVGSTACAWGEISPPSSEEQVAVLGVLDAGAARQTIWLERAFRPGDPLSQPAGIRPLPVPPSRVEVREFAGPSFAFVVDSAMPTRFLADFAPLPGRHYELLIEAGGRRLTATAVVPPPVTILAPANDTVDLSADLTVAWGAGGSRGVAWLVTPGGTGTPVRGPGFSAGVGGGTAGGAFAFLFP